MVRRPGAGGYPTREKGTAGMSMQGNGTVKWYNPEKAYGFITTDSGQDLFVHRNSLIDGRPWLVDGQGVEFSVRQGVKGFEAADVRVVRDVEGIPADRQRLYAHDRRDDLRGNNGYGATRLAAPRPYRAPYEGAIPTGAVPATVMRVDPNGRFLFAQAESVSDDVYVNSALFNQLYLQQGDTITITIERGDRGLRARTLAQR